MNENLKPKGQWGGPREGAGRKLQPSTRVLRKMKRYMELCYIKDFQLMAKMAVDPEKYFGDKVQFCGSEEDSIDKNGKQSQSRSGGYQLEPLFKAQLDLLKWRNSKFLPDAPKEIQELAQELQQEISLRTVNMVQNVQIVNQQVQLQSKDASQVSVTQPTTALPIADQKTLGTQQGSLSSSVIVRSSQTTTS